MATKVHLLPDYEYASPRYHAFKPETYKYLEDDYSHYDSLNGTYDLFWPCFTITETSEPYLALVKINGEEVKLTGDLGAKKLAEDFATRNIGSRNGKSVFINKNLENKNIDYTQWMHPKLNPGWTNIQPLSTVDNEFVGYLIRSLARTDTTEAYLSVDLKLKDFIPTENFAKGIIIKYKDKLYRAETETATLPPGSNWSELAGESNVFQADVYALASDGKSNYIGVIKDKKRKFNPTENGFDTNLVSWNISAVAV